MFMERKGKDLYHSMQSRDKDEQIPWHSAGGAAEGRAELIDKPGNFTVRQMVYQKM